MKTGAQVFLLIVLLIGVHSPAVGFEPAYAREGMVSGPEPRAVRAGVEILRQGGNAFDAAAAIGFALAVTYPEAGNLAGGGFLTAYTSDGKALYLDFRETAPQAARRDLFLNEKGEVASKLSTDSLLAVGVPGTVDGLFRLLREYGTLPPDKILEPAIRLAEEGFPVSHSESRLLKDQKDRLIRFADSAQIFYPGGDPLHFGARLAQPDLARTLRLLAEQGRDAFYEGAIAEKIVSFVQANGGILSRDDLRKYRSLFREPLAFNYKNYTLITPGLPSSGGIALAQIMAMLESTDLKKLGHQSAEYVHALVEAERLAFADRNHFLGDPDFVEVPLETLLSAEYLRQRRELIPEKNAGSSKTVSHGEILVGAGEAKETTHYAVVDRQRNAVAVTYTLNGPYGMGGVVEGAGFLLNNEMDDFSAKPGAANQFGLVQGEANAIEPGKRMLSSMTPTIVLKDGRFAFTIGTPGGPTIITTNLQVFLNITEFGMNIRQAIDSGRFHHQWLPDVIQHEKFALSPDTKAELLDRGYPLEEVLPIGFAAGIQVLEDGLLAGHSDARGEGLCEGY